MVEEKDDVTVWIQEVAAGSQSAWEKLWQRYFDRLSRYAEQKLGGLPRRVVDGEDVAISAMHSLFTDVQQGQLPNFQDRSDLWKFLLTITGRKAKKKIRSHLAQKRGGGNIRGESVFQEADEASAGLQNYAGPTPQLDLAEHVDAACHELLNGLHDDNLRRIAIMKLEGFTNQEIANEQSCTVRSVERKLQRIRALWSEYLDEPAAADD